MIPAPTEAMAEEEQLRIDLSAAFRLTARFDWHESVANHFSAVLSGPDGAILINPRWRHFSLIRASELLKLDPSDNDVMASPNAPDPAAWQLHATVHKRVPQAKILLHCHPPYATALCGLQDPSLKPIDQMTARFYGRAVVDQGFAGFVDQAEEADRLAGLFGNGSILLNGQHGVTVAGTSVAEAFEDLYYLERACRQMVLAYSTNQALAVMSHDLASEVAESWHAYRGAGQAHFDQLKEILDREDTSYRD